MKLRLTKSLIPNAVLLTILLAQLSCDGGFRPNPASERILAPPTTTTTMPPATGSGDWLSEVTERIVFLNYEYPCYYGYAIKCSDGNWANWRDGVYVGNEKTESGCQNKAESHREQACDLQHNRSLCSDGEVKAVMINRIFNDNKTLHSHLKEVNCP